MSIAFALLTLPLLAQAASSVTVYYPSGLKIIGPGEGTLSASIATITAKTTIYDLSCHGSGCGGLGDISYTDLGEGQFVFNGFSSTTLITTNSNKPTTINAGISLSYSCSTLKRKATAVCSEGYVELESTVGAEGSSSTGAPVETVVSTESLSSTVVAVSATKTPADTTTTSSASSSTTANDSGSVPSLSSNATITSTSLIIGTGTSISSQSSSPTASSTSNNAAGLRAAGALLAAAAFVVVAL
jgi:hypothetical protein